MGDVLKFGAKAVIFVVAFKLVVAALPAMPGAAGGSDPLSNILKHGPPIPFNPFG